MPKSDVPTNSNMTTGTPLVAQNSSASEVQNARRTFADRHLGPNGKDLVKMLKQLELDSLDTLIEQTVPPAIHLTRPLQLPEAESEAGALQTLKAMMSKNRIFRSYIGMGYHNCTTPGVIQRNILENPGWYTAYTPYQAEIAQGRLEALLNFQTLIIDLTGREIANASLLDEATAAAEAMSMSYGICKKKKANSFFVSEECHPQTIEVVQTRARPLGIEIIVGDHRTFDVGESCFGVLLQYPASDGAIYDYSEFIAKVHEARALATVAADLLSLTVLTPPGEMDADIVVGSSQRFGVPLGYGGPHAAFLAAREAYKRQVPGRMVGVSKDREGQPALRLALQTREQHIRRDKATSNICTAQVLLAVIASMYAVYHGPEGLKAIANTVHSHTVLLAEGLKKLGYSLPDTPFFDTLRVNLGATSLESLLAAAQAKEINLRTIDETTVGISLDETTSLDDVLDLWAIFAGDKELPFTADEISTPATAVGNFARTSEYLTHPVFHLYHSETELLRYISRLQAKDISLTTSMIPLGSCTMKLNATAEMVPVTWPEVGQIHPFAPVEQAQGYQEMFQQLEQWLEEITGFSAVSLQPNAGSQGEYAGLLVIREYHQQNGQGDRNICLIPESAHGTNPASAVMCGMKVVGVKCDRQGNIDLDDLKAKAEKHSEKLSALMVTYPSTHGVFEEAIQEICATIHKHGGQVYLDGANMNAQVGLCRPGDYGADVCHLNLHKTFCIPHGGGGPGMGPIGVQAHLAPFLPSHSVVSPGEGSGAVAAAPWGSSSILPISWMYIAMMGSQGLTDATKVAILNANYIAHRLDPYYPILYTGKSGFVAHECIVDLRPVKKSAGVEAEDIAKRLMDYGFHAPTMSWPVAGTIMVEPTESESIEELDRFCDAMIAIREEIAQIEKGEISQEDNLLKNAPHTAQMLLADEWTHPYSRQQAAYPAPWTRDSKYWPPVARIDNAFGDRNFVCSCAPMEAYS